MVSLEQLSGLGNRGGQVLAGPPAEVRADDIELEAGKRRSHLAEANGRHRDLEILVLPPLPAEEEIDCPAGRHVPRRFDPGQQTGDFMRPPGTPCCQIGIECPGVGHVPADASHDAGKTM